MKFPLEHRPPATYSAADVEVLRCRHAFHPACLYAWLEEALSDSVDGCGRISAICADRDMRLKVVIARCQSCKDLQTLVRESKVGVRELEELIDSLARPPDSDGEVGQDEENDKTPASVAGNGQCSFTKNQVR